MSLAEIVDNAVRVAANAVAAQTVYFGEPRQLPQSLPAVFVRWADTEPSSATHSVRNTRGASERRGLKRMHSGTMFVLLSTSTDLPVESREQLIAADALMDAFDANQKLTSDIGQDICEAFRITRARRMTQEWEQGIFSGIEAEWEAIEL